MSCGFLLVHGQVSASVPPCEAHSTRQSAGMAFAGPSATRRILLIPSRLTPDMQARTTAARRGCLHRISRPGLRR
eukprot:749592-Hanusia_phi.AAC.4